MNLKQIFVVLGLLALPLDAKRPAGNFGGTKQLDIEKLERNLGMKFSIPFPKRGYDIDFFHKGDFVAPKKGVLVTCPHVDGDLISLAFGSGTDGKSYKMKGDLTISWTKDFKRASIYIMTHFRDEDAPGVKDRPSQKADESLQDFFERVEKFWLKRVAEKKTKLKAAEIKAAFKVMAVALQQKPRLGISHQVSDPTIEKEFQQGN